jgi:hypothetical protein
VGSHQRQKGSRRDADSATQIIERGDKSEHLKAWLNRTQRAIIGESEQDNKIPGIEADGQKISSGTLLRRYWATDNNAFRSLTGVFANRGNLYVTSGSLVYYFSVNDLVSTPVPTPQTTP